jgi:hypothetical protein
MDSREQDAWIAELPQRGWTLHYFPNRESPQAMAATYWHDGYVDVVQLFPEADAFAYRAPMDHRSNPFTPTVVVWTYGSSAVWTIRAALALPLPGDLDAPTMPHRPPPMWRILPDIIQRVQNSAVRPPTQPPQRSPQS